MKEMTLEGLLKEFRSYDLADALRKAGAFMSGDKFERVKRLRIVVEPNPYEYARGPVDAGRRDSWAARCGDEPS